MSPLHELALRLQSEFQQLSPDFWRDLDTDGGGIAFGMDLEKVSVQVEIQPRLDDDPPVIHMFIEQGARKNRKTLIAEFGIVAPGQWQLTREPLLTDNRGRPINLPPE